MCGRARRLHEISELYAAIIRGVDLTPTDQMDALILLNGLQQIRRLTHVVDKLKAALGIPAGVLQCSPVHCAVLFKLNWSNSWSMLCLHHLANPTIVAALRECCTL